MVNEAILDTNVLLRYLTDEPRHLADRATEILDAADDHRVILVVVPLVLAEVVYVLESAYKWTRESIANQLLEIVAASVLDFNDREAVIQTLKWYRDVPKLDFADAYVGAVALGRGHGRVVSFDRDLTRLPGIEATGHSSQLE